MEEELRDWNLIWTFHLLRRRSGVNSCAARAASCLGQKSNKLRYCHWIQSTRRCFSVMASADLLIFGYQNCSTGPEVTQLIKKFHVQYGPWRMPIAICIKLHHRIHITTYFSKWFLTVSCSLCLVCQVLLSLQCSQHILCLFYLHFLHFLSIA